MKSLNVLFFFSSRRRHTISLRDWSSDVCSSDLCAFDRRESLLGGVCPDGEVARWATAHRATSPSGHTPPSRLSRRSRAQPPAKVLSPPRSTRAVFSFSTTAPRRASTSATRRVATRSRSTIPRHSRPGLWCWAARSSRSADTESDRRGRLRLRRLARLPEDFAGGRVGGARENEEQVRQPVQVDGNERVRFVDSQHGALGPPADSPGDKEACRELGPPRQHKRLERLELIVHRVAVGLEPIDQLL